MKHNLTYNELCDELNEMNLTFNEELLNKFIKDKDTNITNLLIAGGLTEEDCCELSLDDMQGIVEFVNYKYDLILGYNEEEDKIEWSYTSEEE